MTRGAASNGRRSRPPAAAPPIPAADSADADLGALLRQAAVHVRALFEKASELASLGWKRLKLRAVDGAFAAVLLIAAAAAGLTIIVAAALKVVAGLQHALAWWAGLEWVGELGGGLLALALPFVGLLIVRRTTRRTLLAKAIHPPVNASAAEPVAPAVPIPEPNGSVPGSAP